MTVVTTLVITTLVIKSKMVNNGILFIMKMRRIRIMIKRNTCSILAANTKEQCSWLGQWPSANTAKIKQAFAPKNYCTVLKIVSNIKYSLS